MRKIIGVAIGGFALAGLLTLAPIPADAGNPTPFTVTKTVVGPGPAGPYAIKVTCVGADTTPDPASFDLNGGGSQVVIIDQAGGTTCSVAEMGTQGASTVSFACMAFGNAQCDDDQTVTFSSFESSAEVDITNTFAAPTPAPTPAPAPAPVEAQPAFTG